MDSVHALASIHFTLHAMTMLIVLLGVSAQCMPRVVVFPFLARLLLAVRNLRRINKCVKMEMYSLITETCIDTYCTAE